MHILEAFDKEVPPSRTQQLPGSSCLVVFPMNSDRVGLQTRRPEVPTNIGSLQEAFETFKPCLHFSGISHGNQYVAELSFHDIDDFEPGNLLKARHFSAKGNLSSSPRNDLGGLGYSLDLWRRLKERWASLELAKSWTDLNQRKEIIASLKEYRQIVDSSWQDEPISDLLKDLLDTPVKQLKASARSVVNILHDLLSLEPSGTRPPNLLSQNQDAPTLLAEIVRLEPLLNLDDSYTETFAKIYLIIERLEAVRDDLLNQLFHLIRPFEISYRQLRMFFENSKPHETIASRSVELYVLNADAQSIGHVFSEIVEVINNFIRERNDNLVFHDDVLNLVIPAFIPDHLRQEFVNLSDRWGCLLVTSLDNEKSFQNIERNFLPGGKYERLLPPATGRGDVIVIAGSLELRGLHSFEPTKLVGLYGSAALACAAIIARTVETSLPRLDRPLIVLGTIVGLYKCRPELLIGEGEYLAMQRQVIPILLSPDNNLYLICARNRSKQVVRSGGIFTSDRLLGYIERCCRIYLARIERHPLTRDFIQSQIEEPLGRLLDMQQDQGLILTYDIEIDKSRSSLMRGICDVTVRVKLFGTEEFVKLTLDCPVSLPGMDVSES